MEYSNLVEVYKALEKTRSRLEMTSIISGFLKTVPEEDLPIILLLLEGRVFPMWSDKELGVGNKVVIKAISTVSGVSEEKIEDMIRETGDTGLAAEKALTKKSQTSLFTSDLTVAKVYSNLDKLASLTGKGSQDKKISYINELLSFSKADEAKYIVRSILEELRLGVGTGIIRDAIAQAFAVNVDFVGRAYNYVSDFGEVAKVAKTKGDAGLTAIELDPGRPIECMLAQKVESVKLALEEFGGRAAFEIKYDGARLQVHKRGEHIELYTRRLENVTKQFPEVVKASRENIKAESAIIEGEMVAIRGKDDRRPRPFQDLSRRIKRKYDIEILVKEIPVEINLFDAIYLNGENLLEKPFHVRRRILEEIVNTTQSFRLADELVSGDEKEAESFYQNALAMGHEGVMAKSMDSPYQPGSRVGYMYKIKPVMETLDLVVTGATWGEGRRAHWLGSYLLSVRDQDSGELLEIGRMATGFSDEELKDMTETLKSEISHEVGQEVRIRPHIVFEVAYEEIQKSPTYSSGYALRFPRLVRIRTDKGLEDIDSLQRVEELSRKDSYVDVRHS